MFASVHASTSEGSSHDDLLRLGRDFSPRLEVIDRYTVVLDVTDLQGMWGDARAIGDAIGQAAGERGLRCRVALAATRIAAVLLVHGRADPLTVIEPGDEAVAVAALPLDLLERVVALESTRGAAPPATAGDRWATIPVRTRFGRSPAAKRYREAQRRMGRMIQVLRRWGLATLGDLAALPRDALFSRLGADGVAWQRCARGEESRPLVPMPEDCPFEAEIDLEWPIEGVEPLAFVLGRVLEPLAARLAREDAAAAVLTVRLWLVTRVWHTRTLELPAPIRDPRVLRTLLVLDLESHPPPAGIDRVGVALVPAPARIVQFSLLEQALPSAEQLSTLLARLTALMGVGRCGAPVVVDTHRPGAFDMQPFQVGASPRTPAPPGIVDQWSASRSVVITILRRFRNPLAARVSVDRGCPVRVSAGGGVGSRAVERCAGPWRSSGHWWEHGTPEATRRHAGRWSHDEWDVALSDGGVYRIYRDRAAGGWFVAGVLD
ncbi:MAG TPA: hypothetical protein QF650_01885 [Vicinamibacterales bacterium]|jgi:protein ImuB|nr:hypothetical protein [Vicinamibacterales bacterium]HJO37333.1 hypothetical protein [Vicinamibacterales bacterium]